MLWCVHKLESVNTVHACCVHFHIIIIIIIVASAAIILISQTTSQLSDKQCGLAATLYNYDNSFTHQIFLLHTLDS